MRILIVLLAACSAAGPAPVPTTPGPGASPRTEPPPADADDFAERVRADFFDGMRGDVEAMERAIALCEETLARQPDHAEAMVWHGAGIVGRANLAFQRGDRATGVTLYREGLAQMDAAVARAPRAIGVRIPRGAVVLAMAPFVPEPEKTRLLERGIEDYEVTLAEQQRYFGSLSLHAREQLLYGLTDGYAQLGKLERAEAYYRRMAADAAGSELLPRAAARAKGEQVVGPTPCEQCHATR
jgi:tetratricopeptide (TPR) repeat protein